MNTEILYDSIAYFPAVVKDIDHVIDLIESTNSLAVSPWENWHAYGESNDESKYGDIKFMQRKLIPNETDESVKSNSEYLIELLADTMADCATEYAKIYDLDKDDLDYAIQALKHNSTKFGINKYETNKFMGPHVDWNEYNSQIRYTIVVYLNDSYTGGELYFNNQDIKLKPVAGSVVMFPSKLPYLHQSLEVETGRKMLITHHWKAKE